MQDFKGKVAVITGAASGIGKGLAVKCVQEGMKVVLADIEEAALQETTEELRTIGAEALLPVLTDVSKAEQVEALAQATIKEFGAVNLLFNNAGVSVSKPLWEFTLNDWQWVLSVNLWGVIHGIHAFLPLMLNQNEESYLVNTSSVQGLVSVPMTAPYNTSKHGIITLSETLYHELIAANKTNVKVAVVCPGLVSTRAYEAERNRPVEWQNPPREISPEEQQRYQMGRKMLEAGMSPAELANIVFEGLREERFYIMTHPHFKPVIQLRMEDIMQERNPSGMQRG